MEIYIKLLYGPYEACGIIRHRVQKIFGLTKYLEGNNYNFLVQPSVHINRLTVEMNERVIFVCDIRNLKFNTTHEDDAVCRKIIHSIDQHRQLFCVIKNVPKYPHISKGFRYGAEQQISESLFPEFAAPITLMKDGESEQDEQAIEKYSEPSSFEYPYFNENDIGEEDEYEDAHKRAKTSLSTESIPSCVCLTIDPPSLYSICVNIRRPQSKAVETSKEITDKGTEVAEAVPSTLIEPTQDEELESEEYVEETQEPRISLEEAINSEAMDDVWSDILQLKRISIKGTESEQEWDVIEENQEGNVSNIEEFSNEEEEYIPEIYESERKSSHDDQQESLLASLSGRSAPGNAIIDHEDEKSKQQFVNEALQAQYGQITRVRPCDKVNDIRRPCQGKS